MSIAKNIKDLREQHQMSQYEFGKVAGVSDKAVSTWENGLKTPRMGAIQKISDYFNIPKSRIIDEGIENPHVRDDVGILDELLIKQLCQLTPDEIAKVDAFVKGLKANR